MGTVLLFSVSQKIPNWSPNALTLRSAPETNTLMGPPSAMNVSGWDPGAGVAVNCTPVDGTGDGRVTLNDRSSSPGNG